MLRNENQMKAIHIKSNHTSRYILFSAEINNS
jgi:hypothetical protein